MYQSETLPKWIRGPVVGPYQLAITIGLFLAALVNYATRLRNDSGSYGIPLAVQFAWSLILTGGLLFLPRDAQVPDQDRQARSCSQIAVQAAKTTRGP